MLLSCLRISSASTWPHQAQRSSPGRLGKRTNQHKITTGCLLSWEAMEIGYRWTMSRKDSQLWIFWSSLAASKAHRIMQACWLATVMACWSITCSPFRATTFSDSMTSVPSICHFTSSIASAVHGVHGPHSILTYHAVTCCHRGLVQLPPCSATNVVAMQFRSTVCTSVESRNVVAHIEPVCPKAQSQMCSNWPSAKQSKQIRCLWSKSVQLPPLTWLGKGFH